MTKKDDKKSTALVPLQRRALSKCTQENMDKVIDILNRGYTTTSAAIAIGVDRKTLYNWRAENQEFCERWALAIEQGTEFLEEEARRRAVEGTPEPVLFKGERTFEKDPVSGELVLDERGNAIPITIRRYSDPLLMLMLKGRKPEVYGDQRKFGFSMSQGEGDDKRTIEIEFVDPAPAEEH